MIGSGGGERGTWGELMSGSYVPDLAMTENGSDGT